MALNAPGGLAYGLAQMAQNIPGSYMAGQQYGLQQKAQQAYDANQNVTYAQNARNLAGQQAIDQTMKDNPIGEQDDDDPTSSPLADQLEASGASLMKQGKAKEGMAQYGQAQQVRQQNIALQQKAQGQIAGLVRMAVSMGEYDKLPTYAQAMGLSATNVSPDPENKTVRFMNKSKLLPADDPDQQGELLEDGTPDPNDPDNYEDADVHAVPESKLMKLDATGASYQALDRSVMTLAQQKAEKEKDRASRETIARGHDAVGRARISAMGIRGAQATAIQKDVAAYSSNLVAQGVPVDEARKQAWATFTPKSGEISDKRGQASARDKQIKSLEDAGVPYDTSHPDYPVYRELVAARLAAARGAKPASSPEAQVPPKGLALGAKTAKPDGTYSIGGKTVTVKSGSITGIQ